MSLTCTYEVMPKNCFLLSTLKQGAINLYESTFKTWGWDFFHGFNFKKQIPIWSNR